MDEKLDREPSDYQVGGSLKIDSPTYVEREADRQLYDALVREEFCYVLTSRQMGKSSLRLRVGHRLRQEGYGRCASVDLTRIGSAEMTLEQWYKGVAFDLLRNFRLTGEIDFKAWWGDLQELPAPQRLGLFLEEILLDRFRDECLFIFIDEIDSVLSLDFDTDDFFALIRSCYDRRAENPNYDRLTFALFGVASPSDLIADPQRTPFNIGTAIRPTGFQLEEARSLLPGLAGCGDAPEAVLAEILSWTGGQPFLTQKVCQLAAREAQSGDRVSIAEVVRSRMIAHWETQDEPEHLRTIRNRLLSDEGRSGRLLGSYQQILETGSIPGDDSPEQVELRLTGLVDRREGHLRVYNRIYREVFDSAWVERQLDRLRPYATALDAWVDSRYRDTSRLLRGCALRDAIVWAKGKSLSNLDYQFLGFSEELDRRETQRALEADRLREVEARLLRERQNARLQRRLLAAIALGLAVASVLGLAAFREYRKAATSEIRALSRSSEAQFASNNRLEAIVEAIRAQKHLHTLGRPDPTTQGQVRTALQQALYGVSEYNRLSGHQAWVNGVSFAPDGTIASASLDGTVRLWHPDGQLRQTLAGHEDGANRTAFSPDGRLLATTSYDRTIRLWQRDEAGNVATQPTKILRGHGDTVWGVAFSPEGKRLASTSWDGTVKLWSRDGRLLQTLSGHRAQVQGVAFHPDGTLLATGSWDGQVKVWSRDGRLLQTLQSDDDAVWDLAFSPDGKFLATAGTGRSVKLWQQEGESYRLRQTLTGHGAAIWAIAFSPDGKLLASAGADKTVRLWQADESQTYERHQAFPGHQSIIWGIAFSPDGKTVASASGDRTVRLWRSQTDDLPALQTLLDAHSERVTEVDFSPDSQLLASASADRTVKLWRSDGSLLKTLMGHDAEVSAIDFHPDGKLLATGSWDKTVKLWDARGKLLGSIDAHLGGVETLAFSPDGKRLATGSWDKTAKLWEVSAASTPVLVATLTGHRGEINKVIFSHHGETIATASGDGAVKLWRRDRGGNYRNYRTLNGHTARAIDVDFSPDDRLLATASWDDTVKLWDVRETATAPLLATLDNTPKAGRRHRTAEVNAADFSPDGRFLVLADGDSTIELWQRNAAGTYIYDRALDGHHASVLDVDFSPDGRSIASAGEDETAIVWHLQPILELDELAYACHWVRDYLKTNAELEKGDRRLCEND